MRKMVKKKVFLDDHGKLGLLRLLNICVTI